jgi:flagellar basal body P-ring formation protein FlgA
VNFTPNSSYSALPFVARNPHNATMLKLLFMTSILLQVSAAIAALPTDTEFQDHNQIKMVVAEFIHLQTATLPGKITTQVEEIDRRLTLPKCAKLEAFLPAGGRLLGKAMVGVRCAPAAQGEKDRASWSIFVAAQIRLEINLLVSARQLPLGHTLQKEDLASQTFESSQSGAFTEQSKVVGSVLRFGIAAGSLLRADMLRQPFCITQGQTVPLSVQSSGFSIHSEGVALNNAAEGQSVQVRVASGRVISGMAHAGGSVEITP